MILNEREPNSGQPLKEMAQFKGTGITLEVRSDDHGKLGSPGDPAHVHILDSAGNKELAEIILPQSNLKNLLMSFIIEPIILPMD
jgi:hypothetical protein